MVTRSHWFNAFIGTSAFTGESVPCIIQPGERLNQQELAEVCIRLPGYCIITMEHDQSLGVNPVHNQRCK